MGFFYFQEEKLFMEKIVFVVFFLILHLTPVNSQEKKMNFLALGDSYTVATGEPIENGWPYQLIAQLGKKDILINEPVIIAGAGWTTTTLLEKLRAVKLPHHFDLVSLMIGVNNQYRGLAIQDFRKEFIILLQKAIAFANGNPSQVVVISIPDWGATPFARFKDREKIALEIAAFNKVVQEEAKRMNVLYVDVTKASKNMAVQPSLIASDSLHPSGRMHKIWAKKIGKRLAKL